LDILNLHITTVLIVPVFHLGHLACNCTLEFI
jgi:hypothetical protein